MKACSTCPDRASSAQWQGHYLALGGIRPSVFADPNQSACSGNTISKSELTTMRPAVKNWFTVSTMRRCRPMDDKASST